MATEAVDVESEMTAVARSLHRVLNRRGVPLDDAEDLVQETLARAWEVRGAFRSQHHLVMWCLRVVSNLRTDQWRHRQRRVDDRELPDDDADDRPAADVELRVLHRLALEEAGRALPGLRPQERAALLRWLRGQRGPEGVPASTEKWWRQAAREHLSRMMESYPAAALVGWRGVAWRWRRRTAALGHGGARTVIPVFVGAFVLGLAPGSQQGKSTDTTPGPARAPITRLAQDAAAGRVGVGLPTTARDHGSTRQHKPPGDPSPRGDQGTRVDVPGPGLGTGAHVWTAPNDETKPLACVRGVEFVAPGGQRIGEDVSACVDHPLK